MSDVKSAPITSTDDAEQRKGTATSDTSAHTTERIQGWLVTYLANLFDMPEQEVDVTIPFDQYGLDSAAAVAIVGDLARWLDQEIDPNIIDDFPSIQTISKHLGKTLGPA